MAKNYAELIQGINQGIPDNDQGLVSPADIRENMIDLADWANELPDIENVKGSYDASTNTPTLTATPDPTFNDGAYYDVTVGGTVGFSGANFTSGTVLNIGDKLKKKGAQWYLIRFAVGDGTITESKISKDTKIIKDWEARPYLTNSQVYYAQTGIIYQANSNTLNTDTPSVSTKWTPLTILQTEKLGLEVGNKIRILGINKYISKTNVETTFTSGKYTDYMLIPNNITQLYYTGSYGQNAIGIIFFDENKNIISYTSLSNITVITNEVVDIPSNAIFFRASSTSSTLAILGVGSMKDELLTLINLNTSAITTINTSLLLAVKESDFTYTIISNNIFDKSVIYDGSYNNVGVNQPSWKSARIPIVSGVSYTIRGASNWSPNQIGLLAYLDTNMNLISTLDATTLNNASGLSNAKTFIAPSNGYIQIPIIVNAINLTDVLCVNKGTVALDYDVFKKVITTIKSSELRDSIAQAGVSSNLSLINALQASVDSINSSLKDSTFTKNTDYTNVAQNTLGNGEIVVLNKKWTNGANVTKITVNIRSIIDTNLTSFDIMLYAVDDSNGILKVGTRITTTLSAIGVYNVPVNFVLPPNSYLAVAIQNGINIGYGGTSTIGGFKYKNGLTNTQFNFVVGNTITSMQTFTSAVGVGFEANEYTGSNVDFSALAKKAYVDSNNYLFGKKIIAGGDSMVKGHTLTDTQTWLYKIANRNNMNYVNYGINGNYLTEGYGTNPLIGRYNSFDNDADYVVIFIGTNDANAGVPIGTDSDTITTTFKGALNNLCNGLITKYPTKKIGFITPYLRNSNYPNYVTAIKTICAKYSIPVFDNIEKGGVCWSNTTQTTAITLGDTYHLNETGMSLASLRYEEFIRSL